MLTADIEDNTVNLLFSLHFCKFGM